MEIIPVIDLLQGQVVRAVKGQRQYYQPWPVSPDLDGSPTAVIRAFLDRYSFRAVYIADLDAIEGEPTNNQCLIDQICESFPQLAFWVDQGLPVAARPEAGTNLQPVIGSETNIGAEQLCGLKSAAPDLILSLDFKMAVFLGDQRLLRNTELWPERVVIMNLDHVGTGKGPDYELIADLRKVAGRRKLYVAGGIRHANDLRLLDKMGIAGALVASALHSRTLSGEDVYRLSKKCPAERGIDYSE